jgi:hypothetical protein
MNYQITQPVGDLRAKFLRIIADVGAVVVNDNDEVILSLGLTTNPEDPLIPYVQTINMSAFLDGATINSAAADIPLKDYRNSLSYLIVPNSRLNSDITACQTPGGDLSWMEMRLHGQILLPKLGKAAISAQMIFERIVPETYLGLQPGRVFRMYDNYVAATKDFCLPICLVETFKGPAIAGIMGYDGGSGTVRNMSFDLLHVEDLIGLDLYFDLHFNKVQPAMMNFWIDNPKSTPATDWMISDFYEKILPNGACGLQMAHHAFKTPQTFLNLYTKPVDTVDVAVDYTMKKFMKWMAAQPAGTYIKAV